MDRIHPELYTLWNGHHEMIHILAFPLHRHGSMSSMARRLVGAKALSEPMLAYGQLDHKERNSVIY